MTYVEVAVVAPLAKTLTYLLPDRFGVAPDAGLRFLVPLGRRKITGYCLGEGQPLDAGKVKEVADVLSADPLFPPSLIPFFRWISDYYHHPLGQVVAEGLPGGLTMKSGRRARLTEAGKKALAEDAALQPLRELAWVEELLAVGSLSPAAVRLLLQGEDARIIRRLERGALLFFEQELAGRGIRPKMETVVRSAVGEATRQAGLTLKKSEQKTLESIAALTKGQTAAWLPKRLLTTAYGGAGRALPALLDKGLVEQKERRLMRDPFGLEPPFYPRPEKLTDEQQQALDVLLPAVRKKNFDAFLLHGITGSGKTEVYLRAAEEAIASGRSVLVLVPEIALATQLEGHFYSRFGDLTALLHSGLSAGERFDQWQRIADGSAMVVIGARSAIFAPLADPGLIVVDEEHDGAYKQEEGLRYQARDLALLRGRMQKSTVILGSATPAVTSFMHARQGKFRLLTMNRRVEDRRLPAVAVVDMKQVERKDGEKPLFSPQLLEALHQNLERNEQSLLFLNRRGFASLLICRDCGHPVQCRNCQVSLTLHKGAQQLVCHHCGYRIKAAAICEHCKGGDLVMIGFGTERIEEELRSLLPAARIARLDRDSISKRRDFYTILNRVRQHEVDIVVGTQMIAKGHHFPAVTLVGVVWADAGLGMPDYKAGERTFQLLCQVMGRAGRGEKSGRVIVQTFQPDHYSIQCARTHDYSSFLEQELALRQALSYPPFSRLVNFFFDGNDEKAVQAAAAATGATLRSLGRQHQELAVLGPAPLFKLGGRFRWQCLLRSASVEKLHRCCLAVRAASPPEVRSGKVRLIIDVDPEGML